jgi:hypothetical protein
VTGEFPYFTALSQEFSYIRSVGGRGEAYLRYKLDMPRLDFPTRMPRIRQVNRIVCETELQYSISLYMYLPEVKITSKSIDLPLNFIKILKPIGRIFIRILICVAF